MRENVKNAMKVENLQTLGSPPAALRQPSARRAAVHRDARGVLVSVIQSSVCVIR
jgi:hypothetical protein